MRCKNCQYVMPEIRGDQLRCPRCGKSADPDDAAGAAKHSNGLSKRANMILSFAVLAAIVVVFLLMATFGPGNR